MILGLPLPACRPFALSSLPQFLLTASHFCSIAGPSSWYVTFSVPSLPWAPWYSLLHCDLAQPHRHFLLCPHPLGVGANWGQDHLPFAWLTDPSLTPVLSTLLGEFQS